MIEIPTAPDVARRVAFLGEQLDRAYVRRWLVDTLGEGNPRVSRWDAMVAG
jgi:hypothetical protein